jgi:hypothetical protein
MWRNLLASQSNRDPARCTIVAPPLAISYWCSSYACRQCLQASESSQFLSHAASRPGVDVRAVVVGRPIGRSALDLALFSLASTAISPRYASMT